MRYCRIMRLLGLSFLAWLAGLELNALQSAVAQPDPTAIDPNLLIQKQDHDFNPGILKSVSATVPIAVKPLTKSKSSIHSESDQVDRPSAVTLSNPSPSENIPLTPARIAQESIDQTSITSVNQPSVSQLSDVAPTDWAYQAFSHLIERYGCLVGYPDGRFQGKRVLSRYEFAAGVNACLEAIVGEPIDGVSREDLAQLQRLSQEFETELITLRGKVDALEARTSEVEAAQFSTTTQFNVLSSFNFSQALAAGDVLAEGIPIPGVSPAARLPLRSPITNDPVVGTVDDNPPATFSQSTYIIFRTSFTGLDELTTLLAVGNGDPPASGFTSGGLTSTFGIPYADSNPVPPLSPNSVGLFELKYSFPVLPSLQVVVGPRILPFRHFDTNLYTDVLRGASGLNFYQSTLAGNGLSGAGGLLEWTISPQFLLRVGYLARNDASLRVYGPNDGPVDRSRGLFNSTNSILAELTFSPTPDANIRLLYNRARIDAPESYPPGVPPILLLQSLRGAVDDGFGGRLDDLISHNFVFNFDWTITPRFALFGRYSYSTSAINPIDPNREGGDVNVQAFQLGAAFPDLGKAGALGTLTAVIPFDVLSGRRFFVGGYGDGGTQIDFLASYSYPLTNEISLVPMFFATLNANNFSGNPTIYSIILRTQFLF